MAGDTTRVAGTFVQEDGLDLVPEIFITQGLAERAKLS